MASIVNEIWTFILESYIVSVLCQLKKDNQEVSP